jgi:DNA helicase-2/ATP-dependent DNA helicase PcrA
MSRDNPDEGKYEDSFRKKLRDGVKALKRENCELEELESWIKKEQSGSDEPSSRIKKYKELCTYFERYEKFMKERGKIDFEDMVKNAITKLSKKGNESVLDYWRKKYEHIIIDEFQDNNYLQTKLGWLLSPKGHITVVGDEDQCIYGFQGARVENFEHFEDNFKSFSQQ